MQRKKILVVDDDKNALAVITQMLRRDGYSIDWASSGKEALEKFTAEHYDLLILDYMMPGMDGLDVMLEVKKLRPEVKVIMITAVHLTIEKAVDAMKRGASDYVTKPFEMKVFRETVKRILASVTAETLELDKLKEASPVVKFGEHFRWIPRTSLIFLSGPRGTQKRLFAQQLAYAHMLKGEAVVYLTADLPPKGVEEEVGGLLPVRKFMDAGLLTILSPHAYWESDDIAPSYRFLNLREFAKKIFRSMDESLKVSREVMLVVDSFSTQCSMLKSDERVQLLHMLRSLTRRRPVTVVGIAHEKQKSGRTINSTVPGVTRYIADVAMAFEIGSRRNVVKYTVGKLPGRNEARGAGELESRGGLLTPLQ